MWTSLTTEIWFSMWHDSNCTARLCVHCHAVQNPRYFPPCHRHKLPQYMHHSTIGVHLMRAQHMSPEGKACACHCSQGLYLIVTFSEGAVPNDLTLPHGPGFTVWIWVTWEGLSWLCPNILDLFSNYFQIPVFQSSYWWVSSGEIILQITIVISTETAHLTLQIRKSTEKARYARDTQTDRFR